MATTEELCGQIAECLQVDPSEVTPQTVAGDLPGWDSMAVVDLVFMLQREYDISLPPSEASSLNSVEALVKILRDAGKLE